MKKMSVLITIILMSLTGCASAGWQNETDPEVYRILAEGPEEGGGLVWYASEDDC